MSHMAGLSDYVLSEQTDGRTDGRVGKWGAILGQITNTTVKVFIQYLFSEHLPENLRAELFFFPKRSGIPRKTQRKGYFPLTRRLISFSATFSNIHVPTITWDLVKMQVPTRGARVGLQGPPQPARPRSDFFGAASCLA